MYERHELIIGGRPRPAGGAETITVVNPATEEVVGHAPSATPEEVDLAVETAAAAFRESPWRQFEMEKRVAVVEAMCAALEPRLEEILRLVTAEMGVPIKASRALHRDMAIGSVRHACAAARRIAVEERRDGQVQALVRLEPTGVVAAIAPWNGPFLQALYKIVYPLLAGCSVVFKPAPETPLDAYLVAEAFAEAGLPDGVLSVVPGGPAVGERLVAHPGVDAVFFTGSTETGRRIGAVCGANMKRAVLELGGKSAAIVLEDADLAATLPGLTSGAFGNTGQNCAATSRVLVARSRYDEVLEGLAESARSLVVGDPQDEATGLGPLVSSRQRDRVEGHVAAALADGAVAAEPGGRPDDLPRGWFLRPTVLGSVDNRSRVAQEEIFGPVVCVIPVEDDVDAIRTADDSAYGLHGAVYSEDDERALAVARAIRTGTFSVNGFLLNSELPFGGVKASGRGRKYGVEGIREFMEIKTINFARSAGSFSMR
ncbi:aldehyde dehydrogenase [Actinomycetospora chibensis]|uniref:aldehyde dehydrogenase (NAD(+)) n=1 Tax=Actinomycetospora chibensis TaxID=663606 RepID=A0ABV9RHK9_9PSEU|nr:aldehyde dehydrogenase [Actinomycetospora chibensis]MDD7927631.1 aldehyde dehydrogenase [Actinomycetospora chibensis]